MKQLSRKINAITYYCELITPDYTKARTRKDAAKKAGFKARIISVDKGWAVYQNNTVHHKKTF